MLTVEQYNANLAKVRTFVVDWPQSPSDAWARLGAILISVQAYRNQLHPLLVEAFENRLDVKLESDAKDQVYKSKRDEILATDEQVKAAKTVDLRESAANTKVATLALASHQYHVALQQADTYVACLQQTQRHLDAAFETISKLGEFVSAMKTQ